MIPVHCDLDAADADATPCGDLEKFEAQASARGDGEAGVGEAEAAQSAEQHIGHRLDPQAESVRAHAVRRGAVGEQVELALLDAVLHLAALAGQVLVQAPGVIFPGSERGDDETRIGLAVGPFGLAADPAFAAPYAGGLTKFEPGEIERLPVPPVQELRERRAAAAL